jgi:hypothetical protein
METSTDPVTVVIQAMETSSIPALTQEEMEGMAVTGEMVVIGDGFD